jgi:hypothetical protein
MFELLNYSGQRAVWRLASTPVDKSRKLCKPFFWKADDGTWDFSWIRRAITPVIEVHTCVQGKPEGDLSDDDWAAWRASRRRSLALEEEWAEAYLQNYGAPLEGRRLFALD